MTTKNLYSRAPITEALIDIQVIPSQDYDVELLSSINKNIGYSIIKKQIEGQITFDFAKDISGGATSKQIGYRVETSDNKYVLQAKKSSFTFSRLAPYERWEILIDEAKRVWEVYSNLSKPSAITRCAIRFINRFDIPQTTIEISDYFTINPQVPTGYDLNGVYMQLIIPQESVSSSLVINQAVVPPPEGKVKTISIVLDLDLFNTTSNLTLENVWERLEQMHSRMDEIFEEIITEKTRDLIR